MKRVSVVLVSYNTKDLLRKAIQSILPQLDPKDDELIIVDNQSPDHSALMIGQEFPQVNLLALDKNYGYGYGVNRGVERATGKYILVTNSDVSFTPNAVKSLHEKMAANNKVGVVCPELVDFNGELKQLTWQWKASLFGELMNKLFSPISLAKRPVIRRLLPLLQRKERVVSGLSGAAFLIDRHVMEKINGFDERFQLYYEDTDLFERVHLAGYQLLFAPGIKVFHGLGGSTQKNDLSKTYLIFIQSRLYYYKKHLPRIQHALLKCFLKMKFLRSKEYRKGGEYRRRVDLILKEQETIALWQDIKLKDE